MGRAHRSMISSLPVVERLAETVWFHGTSEIIEEVDIMRSSGDRILGPGFYCTDSQKAAANFGSRVHRVLIQPSRVLDLEGPVSGELLHLLSRVAQDLERKWSEPPRKREGSLRWRLVAPEGNLIDIVEKLGRASGSQEDVFADFRRALYFRSLDNNDQEGALQSLHKHLIQSWDALLMRGVPGKSSEECHTLVLLQSSVIRSITPPGRS